MFLRVASALKKRHTDRRMNTTATHTLILPLPDNRLDVLILGSIILLGNILALLISL
jgi:hypothetical protein